MKIEVIVTGNRSLYRSIYESIDRTTTHRTATGAARAILKVERDSAHWARSCGHWGSYTIAVNGIKLDRDEEAGLAGIVAWALDDRYSDPVKKIASWIEELRD